MDGSKKHILAEVGPGRPLRWDMQLFPWLAISIRQLSTSYLNSRYSDVQPNSTILIKIIERRYMSPDHVRHVSYLVSGSATSNPIELITESSSRRTIKQIIAVVRFPDPEKVSYISKGEHISYTIYSRLKTPTSWL